MNKPSLSQLSSLKQALKTTDFLKDALNFEEMPNNFYEMQLGGYKYILALLFNNKKEELIKTLCDLGIKKIIIKNNL